tara:strand:+ start:549 stop:668 length:120 start_codon:yes stop_codon:yes gene_type:complete
MKEEILKRLDTIEWLLAVHSTKSLKDIELQIKILRKLLK